MVWSLLKTRPKFWLFFSTGSPHECVNLGRPGKCWKFSREIQALQRIYHVIMCINVIPSHRWKSSHHHWISRDLLVHLFAYDYIYIYVINKICIPIVQPDVPRIVHKMNTSFPLPQNSRVDWKKTPRIDKWETLGVNCLRDGVELTKSVETVDVSHFGVRIIQHYPTFRALPQCVP